MSLRNVLRDAAFEYVHEQGVPSALWTIAHYLDRYPPVTVVDSAGDQVEGEVRFVDPNNIQITFSAPFSGRAYLGG